MCTASSAFRQQGWGLGDVRQHSRRVAACGEKGTPAASSAWFHTPHKSGVWRVASITNRVCDIAPAALLALCFARPGIRGSGAKTQKLRCAGPTHVSRML